MKRAFERTKDSPGESEACRIVPALRDIIEVKCVGASMVNAVSVTERSESAVLMSMPWKVQDERITLQASAWIAFTVNMRRATL